MAIPSRPQKNIWVAAGDGDLDRVRELVEQQGISPNIPDAYTYTPMHAAASYGQLEVLEYLISHGGDINVTDNDGDSPLYTVESIDTARWLVNHGALVDRTNSEGVSPIEHLSEDFPLVSQFLQSLVPPTNSSGSQLTSDATPIHTQPSQHQQNAASEHLTSELMASVQDIMQRAETDGRNPDEELRQAVSRTVLEGMVTGFGMTTTEHDQRDARQGPPPVEDGTDSSPAVKRARRDEP